MLPIKSITYANCLIVSFFFLPVLIFWLDSPALMQGVEAQPLANICLLVYFLAMLFGLTPRQRLTALVFVPFAFLGESLFSHGFELYSYRLGNVPLYISFGHGVVFSVGVLIAESGIVRECERWLKPVLMGLLWVVMVGAIAIFHDTLSLIFALVFLWVLRRKGYQTFYFVMAFLALYVELLGTSWGCWTWFAHPVENWSWLQTTNPPVGTFVCYVLADIAVVKITRQLECILLKGPLVQAIENVQSAIRPSLPNV